VSDHLDPGAIEVESHWGKIVAEFGALTAPASADYKKTSGVPVMQQLVDGTPAWLAIMASSPNFGGNSIPITTEPLFRIEISSTRSRRKSRRRVFSSRLNRPSTTI